MTKRPRSSWRRRCWRLLLALIVLRALLALSLLPLARFAAGMAGLDVNWRSASLSLLGLSFHAEDLVVTTADPPMGPPLLTVEDVIVDASLLQLLRGMLSLVDVAASGVRLDLRRTADGRLQLPPAWLQPAPTPAPPAPRPAPSPPSFAPPLHIASARLFDLQLDWHDATTAPPTHLCASLDLDVKDLGHAERPASARLRLHAPALIDAAWFTAEAQTRRDRLDVTWNVTVAGVRTDDDRWPEQLRQVLHDAHLLGLDLSGTLIGEVAAEEPHLVGFQGTLQAAASLDGQPHLTLSATLGPPTRVGNDREQSFSLAAHCADIVDELRLDGGRWQPTTTGTRLCADASARALTLRRLTPLLIAAGITLPTDGLDLRARLDAEFGEAFSLRLDEAALQAAGTTTTLRRVDLRDLRRDGDTIVATAVELLGPSVALTRTSGGDLVVAGIRLATKAPATPAAAAAPPTAAAPLLPRLRLGSFVWRDLAVTCLDETRSPAATLTLRDVEVRADGLTIGHEAPPARWSVRARLPGCVDAAQVDGTLTASRTALAIDLSGAVGGIDLTSLKPWLLPSGITPMLAGGTLQFAAGATLRTADTGLRVDARLHNVRLNDGERVLLRLRRVTGSDAGQGPGGTDLGTWTLEDPFVALHQGVDGAIELLGLRLGGAPAARPAAPLAAVDIRPRVADATPVDPRAAGAPGPTDADRPPPRGTLRLRGGGVQFTDANASEPLLLAIDAEGRLGDDAGASTFDATLRLDGAFAALRCRGDYEPGRTASFTGELEATGVQGGGLSRLLPAGVTCVLQQGTLRGRWRGSFAKTPFVEIEALQLADRGTELAAIDRIELRFGDVTPERVHIHTATVAGARALLTATPEGLQVPGFALVPAAPAPTPAPGPGATTAPPATATATLPGAVTPPATPLRLPMVSIEALSFGLDRLVFRDRSTVDGEPLTLTGTLRLLEPWQPRESDEQHRPARFELTGSALPLCADFHATIDCSPYDLAPTIDGEVRATGIDLTALTRVLPPLADRVEGRTRSGELTARWHLRIDPRRREPRQLDLTRPFGGELHIEDLRFGDGKDAALLSVAAIDVVARAIDLHTGDVMLRSVAIDDPQLRIANTTSGLLLLGLCLLPTEAQLPAAAPPAATPATHTAAAADEPGPELTIDRFELQGLRIDVEDHTTEPVTRLPISALDLRCLQVSTRAIRQARPLQFQLLVQGDAIELERRVVASSVLAGLLGSATQALTGAADTHTMESRPWLESLQASGQLTLFPRLTGNVRANVQALELPALRGLAKPTGVDLADGVFDLALAVDLRGADGIDIDSRPVFTWLSLSEPAGGPISTYLKLPAPLDSVLFLLKNDTDEHRLPLHISVPDRGPGSGAVTEAVIETLSRLIADAVASAGTRMLGTVTGAIGLTGAGPPPAVASCEFAAGSPLPLVAHAASGDLAAILTTLRGSPTTRVTLVHELGEGDLEHLAGLVGPPAGVITSTIDRMRLERRRSQQEQAGLAAATAALYDAGRISEARREQARLAALADRLGRLEEALDEALAMLAGDAERAKQRRVRAAANALANARLFAVRDHLHQLLPALSDDRIQVRPPRPVPTAGRPTGGRIAVTAK